MVLDDIRSLILWKKKKEAKSSRVNTKEFKIDKKGYPEITFQHKQHLKEESMVFNYPIGTKVVCKSNNNEPYLRGTIVDYEAISLAKNLTPVVKFEGEEEPFLVLGIIRPYSPELCEALDKLTPIEQWNVLSEFYKISK